MRKSRLPFLIIGIVLIAFFVFMAIFPQAFTSYGRKESFDAWIQPCLQHPLGTNSLGYDVFTELVYAARETLLIGIVSGILSLLIGAVIGILAANKSFIGSIFNGIVNVFVLIPKLVVLIVISSFITNSQINSILLISIFGWAATARNVRAKVIHIKSQPFIENCKIYGLSKVHITVKHIIPNLYDVLLSRFLIGVNSCIMMESTLSFLGLGNIYYPTWGSMINFAYTRGAIINESYLYLLIPCICIMLLSLAFYFIAIYIDGSKNTIKNF